MATHDIPGPSGYPLIGNTYEYSQNPFEFQQRCAEEYGDVVSIRFGKISSHLVFRPEYIERILVNDNNRFKKPEIVKKRIQSIVDDGLLANEGEAWKRRRELLQPWFTPRQVASYSAEITDSARELVERWEPGSAYHLDEEMRAVTLRILVRALFGVDIRLDEYGIQTAVKDVTGKFHLGRIPIFVPEWVPTPTNRRFKRGLETLDAVIQELIDSRLNADDDRNDLLTRFLNARERNEGGLSDKAIRDEMITLLLAGHETTALSITYTLHLLARNPEAMATLRDELDSVLGGSVPTIDDVPDLTYTENVIKESLRLYPPVFSFSRESTCDVDLGDHTIPNGSMVEVSAWVVHRDERFYDEPERFAPDRWTAEMRDALPEYAYFPFGAGPRQCIGRRFATLEATLLVATIAQRYDLEFETDGELDLTGIVVAQPTDPVTMTVRERRDGPVREQ